ncbi:hypothetical protein [Streptomyces turgidiscabies]|uniref:UL36 very large tegument protein n=1 Tax=Streptomyces turgidiscabies TaxID=85558 RepID=A0ABU0RYN6_9ACTN|nr:hypothetical protein [Streptomyces turgidiscabies]MDQ0937087.1 hypothetical protein [Streptomyces turgidiscabies]
MAVEQLPMQVREFARYLHGLLARLDQGAGWCGVFWQRDPDGMRACLEGREVPPWDVVEALLQDLAAGHGTDAVTPEAERARALHQASLTVFDARPGARDSLGDRLDVMHREQKYAAERLAELRRSLDSAATHEEAEGLRLDLAWAHDDHERASARCAELRYRLDQLARGAVSRAPVPHRDRDEEADLFAGGVRNTAPHPADPAPLPRQRTATDQQLAGYENERGAHEQPSNSPTYGNAGHQSPDNETPTWRDDPRRTNDHDGARPAVYGGDRSPGRQDSGDGAPAWRDDPRRTDGHDGARPAVHGDDRAFGRQGSGGEASGRRDDGRPVGRQEDRDGAPYGDDRRPGRQAPGGEGADWLDGDRHVGRVNDRDGGRPADASGEPEAPDARPAPQLPADWYAAPAVAPAPDDSRPAAKQRSKRRARGSARFAGAMDDADTGGTPAVEPTQAAPAPAAPGRRSPRGARFAGAAAAAKRATPVREALDDDARHDTIDAVRSLVRLRSEGRSGEAHALLVEASQWPAARFPLLAAELHRAGLGADWATLLWEAASLPADRLVAAADALVAAGRVDDGQQTLRQGMVRPAHEVGEAVLRLAEDGRRREVRALLDAYVRVSTPEEAARSVAADPQRLVPLLLEAAKGASEGRYWDVVHALRVAGHSA